MTHKKADVKGLISFDVTKEELDTTEKIIQRVKNELVPLGFSDDYQSLQMDVIACHCNGTPLDLEKLLKADLFSFFHDLAGIQENMDRTTGMLTGHFLPRTSVPSRAGLSHD